jgi:hypothetical protein
MLTAAAVAVFVVSTGLLVLMDGPAAPTADLPAAMAEFTSIDRTATSGIGG